jgi:hypothetical protein
MALIQSSAFIDRNNGETVCRIAFSQIIEVLSMQTTDEPLIIGDIPKVCRGLVLHDPQTRGEFDNPCKPTSQPFYTD